MILPINQPKNNFLAVETLHVTSLQLKPFKMGWCLQQLICTVGWVKR
jgi:hypothetical protein